MNTPDSTTETPSRLVDVNGPRLIVRPRAERPMMLHAANDLFVENKGLDHGYALSEFMRETVTMLEESGKLEGRTLQ